MNTPAYYLYAVAITAMTPEPDATIQTYVRCIGAASTEAARATAEEWVVKQHADQPGPWFYQYAVSPAIATMY